MIKKQTRHCGTQTPFLIDHVWVNNPLKVVHNSNLDTESVHNLITVTLKTKGTVKTKEISNSKDFRGFKKEDFVLDLLAQIWTSVYQLTDVTLIDDEITELFTSMYIR